MNTRPRGRATALIRSLAARASEPLTRVPPHRHRDRVRGVTTGAESPALGAVDRLRRLRPRRAARLTWAVLGHQELRRTNVVVAALTAALLVHAMTSLSTSTTASTLEAVEVGAAPAPAVPLDRRVEPAEVINAGFEECVPPSDDASRCDVAAALSAEAPVAAPAVEAPTATPTPPAVAPTPPPPARPTALAAEVTPSPPPPPTAEVREDTFAAATFQAVNIARGVVGLAPFTPNASLTAGAKRYAAFLLDRGVIDHYLDGEPWDRAARAGYPSALVGEVLALYATSEPLDSTADTQRQVDAWMNSPGHRDALLSKDFPFSEAGFGCAVGKDLEGRNLLICAGLVGVP